MRAVLLTLGMALAGPAAAHDTWFVPQGATDRGELLLALGTGTQYPVLELPVLPPQVASGGCRGDGVNERSLRRAGERANALLLRTPRPVPAGVGLSCWAQLVPIEIDIDDATVQVYLDEVNAPAAVRERWAQLRARGVRWQETYVKHARIELDGQGAAASGAQAVDGLGLDVRMETPERPLRAGARVRFQVLRDGRPLPGLPVELRSDRPLASPAPETDRPQAGPAAQTDRPQAGRWHTTDADGRIEQVLPHAGRWILRGTEIRPSATTPDRWDSRFVTLTFDVLP